MEPKNLTDTKGGQALDRIHTIQSLVIELRTKTCHAVNALIGPDNKPISEPAEALAKEDDGVFPRMLASITLIEEDIAECVEALGRLQS